ncbi:helix-turn-helix transcriptional regulator [Photorhabdus heterorhabditis]|uniref:helix-turn-helix transcriptional regulator n=1 Tax=Photorhabdus heterorhabditis TaxID=880156 RepID=UPI001562AA24|nr:HTH domain-containing protein [Photorhabdus heterorhabditis]NRN28959.1 HTH domain-containing protein [Photorhabdus heterorhabditis subsp. aluminescens]
MSRTERLMALLQYLRQRRYPVSGNLLANDLSISLRTLYRDIALLNSQGANIEGEPGLGYILRPGFLLPPLMFTIDEIDALVLGNKWVIEQNDVVLAKSAHSLISKLAAVLPEKQRDQLHFSPMLVKTESDSKITDNNLILSDIRKAIYHKSKIIITFLDLNNTFIVKTICPLSILFNKKFFLVSWCEFNHAFFKLQVEKIKELNVYPIDFKMHRDGKGANPREHR